MIRAFSQKLEKVEQDINDHDDQIKRINCRLEEISTREDQVSATSGENDHSGATETLKFTLDKISASVKETRFCVNDLVSKVSRHEGELQELKSVLSVSGAQQNAAGQGKLRSIPGGCNPNASEFHPRGSPRALPSPRTSPLDASPRGPSHMNYLFTDDKSLPFSFLPSPRSDDGATDTSFEADFNSFKGRQDT